MVNIHKRALIRAPEVKHRPLPIGPITYHSVFIGLVLPDTIDKLLAVELMFAAGMGDVVLSKIP
ncbi:MAG: hypothetical protein M2R46_03276 [Verrucomicrobia subdivision 3 bacterium]|nr:hypothetical protein [Limisphaerales bacterium]